MEESFPPYIPTIAGKEELKKISKSVAEQLIKIKSSLTSNTIIKQKVEEALMTDAMMRLFRAGCTKAEMLKCHDFGSMLELLQTTIPKFAKEPVAEGYTLYFLEQIKNIDKIDIKWEKKEEEANVFIKFDDNLNCETIITGMKSKPFETAKLAYKIFSKKEVLTEIMNARTR